MEPASHTLSPDPFTQQLQIAWPIEDWTNVSVLIAVSGGPDSVALLRALHTLRSAQNTQKATQSTRLEVAHFNHGWRDTAEQDEQFVAALCSELSVTLHVGHARSTKQTEETARSERYAFLQSTAEQRGARYLATAHTANDQAETILHRIIRGTGPKGLVGIQRTRKLSEAVTVVRPMLWATRQEVLRYLTRSEQEYRVDESNSDTRYTRNRIRHELLPHLAQHYNSNIIDSLLRLGQLSAEVNDVIQSEVGLGLEECITAKSDNMVELDRDHLIAKSDFLLRETLVAVWRNQGWPEQSMGFDQWNRLAQAVRSGDTVCLPGGVRISSDSGHVRLHRAEA